jgi:DNA (cytosine-5)-methyltransferase 1
MSDKKNLYFTFADLFAGIGGMRYAFEGINGKCVFTSEKDKDALKTYAHNFGSEGPLENIDILEVGPNLRIEYDDVPDFDVLVAGFPCQPYSIAGLRKGLTDVRGGDIFLKLIDLLSEKKPKAFLLENVAGLNHHDQGSTYHYMEERLTDAGYWVYKKLMNTKDYTQVPQNRPRLFIIGLSKSLYPDYPNEKITSNQSSLPGFTVDIWPEEEPNSYDILHYVQKEVAEKYYYTDDEGEPKFECSKELKEKLTLKDTLYQWRRVYVRENKDKKCPTLTANMGSGGHNVPLLLDETDRIRKLTPLECAEFQGFSKEKFEFPLDNKRYHQIGNSVTVPLIAKIAEKLIQVMQNAPQ